MLAPVEREGFFRLHLGAEIESLEELADALEVMDDVTFSHHVNKERNDFHPWILDVIQDKKLATVIKTATTKKMMAQKVRRRVGQLQKKLLAYDATDSVTMHNGMKDFLLGLIVGLFIGLVVSILLRGLA
ncbi:hypothetical protein GOV04_02625 [Candidatus Woesearchaeota archaeon]|nr:hypothetical protein [Candidatus Woesearchaeota archaeon]